MLPKRLTQEDIAGITIRDGRMVGVRLARTPDGGVRLRSVGWADCRTGGTDDDRSATIRHAWRHLQMSTRTVVAALDAESVQLKHFQYEHLSASELSSALALEAEELLRRPRTGLALDWHLFGEGGNGAAPARRNGRVEGLLVATPREELDRQLLVLKHAGLYTVVMDVAPLALANLYRTLRDAEKEPESVCLLDISERAADAVVLCRDGFAQPRVLRSHAAAWDAATEYLAENLTDLLRYVRFHSRKPAVQRLYLTGQRTDLHDIGVELQQALGIQVVRWNPLDDMVARWPSRVKAAKVRAEVGPGLAGALGLALRGAAHDHV